MAHGISQGELEDFFRPGTQARASACCISMDCTAAAVPGASFCAACDARIAADMRAEAAALGYTYEQLCEAYALPDNDPELRARIDAWAAADREAIDADEAFIAGALAGLALAPPPRDIRNTIPATPRAKGGLR